MPNTELSLFTGEELKNKPYNQNNYIIENLVKGNKVNILTGGSKTGKSTLALQMAYSVSKGVPFLNMNSKQYDVLYICLDNDEDLIVERLNLMNLKMDNHIMFCFNKAITLQSESSTDERITLLEIINETYQSLPNLGFVIIDLFDNIRNLSIYTESNNIKDAQDMEFVKGIADTMSVHILLLNHDTKNGIQNGYCSSKGGVKLVGTCNGSYLHLIRNGIKETNATLEVGGRNIREDKIRLSLNTTNLIYTLLQNEIDDDMPYEIGIVRNYIIKNNGYEGTISNLLQLTRLTIAANKMSRLLNTNKDLLKSEGISFSINPSRTNGRIYTFFVNKDD